MYLPVYVYDCAAGKKKSILSLSIFSAKLPPAAFLLGQQAAAQSAGLEVPLLHAGNQEETQSRAGCGPAIDSGTGGILISACLPSQVGSGRPAGVG